jgi:S1-C subfamily serine protease
MAKVSAWIAVPVCVVLAACAGTPAPADGTPATPVVSQRSVVSGTIGVMVEPSPDGLRVAALDPAGAAARAGLEKGDVVLRAQGRPLPSVREFNTRVVDSRPGRPLRLDVRRGAQALSIDVTVEQVRSALLL